MFEPIYTSTSETLGALDEIERLRFRIERFLIMPKHEAWLKREAALRSAYYSTMIENPSIREDEVDSALQAVPAEGPVSTRLDVANVESALLWIDFVSDDSDVPIDERLVRNINWLVMKGLAGVRNPGVYRTEPNWIEDKGLKVYDPPFHGDVPDLMHQFSQWLSSDSDTHPLVRAAISHIWLVAIHPFVDGNGRTARLLSTLVLQRYGFGFRKLLSLDAYYARNRDAYIDGLQKTLGQRFRGDADLTPWIDFFCLSILTQTYGVERTLTDWRIMMDEAHRDFQPLGLNERQIDGLLYALRTGRITRKDYIEITGVSPLTASRDLAYLVSKALLAAVGHGRSRRFMRVSPPKERAAEEEQRRLM